MKNESLKDGFQKLVAMRMLANGFDLVNTSEYKGLTERGEEIKQKMESLLGSENEHLVEDFDDICAQREELAADHSYQVGFKDAFELKPVIDSILGIAFQEESASLSNVAAN